MTKLHAGAAEVDITPPIGTHMSGDLCRLRPVEKVLDPLFARALVLASGDTQLCILTLDLCTTGDDISKQIREQVAGELGTSSTAVMLHLEQNHSAPSLGGHLLLTADSPCVRPDYWWVYEGDPDYADFVRPRILTAVKQAAAALEPVDIACGGMADGRVSFNRRFIMRDGTVCTQPGDRRQVLHPEGPGDPEVGVAGFRNQAGELVAVLLHHTAHPVSHFGKQWVTASWPGAWAKAMKGALGQDCVPLVLNGCCGNVNSRNLLMPDYQINDHLIGQWLTDTATTVIDEFEWQSAVDLGVDCQQLEIAHSDLAAQLGVDAVAHAEGVLANQPEPRWRPEDPKGLDSEWLFAAVTLDLLRRLPGNHYSYPVQTFHIGPLALVGLTGEPFVQGQLRLKQESPANWTFVAHMCNGWIGYIPTPAAYHADNYNFRTPEGKPVRRGANIFLLDPKALDQIVDQSVQQLNELWAE